MYPLGIDDRLKKTPIVESLVLPHPLYQGDRLSSPTSIGLCITHPSLNKALGSRFLAPKSSRPSSRCSSLSDVDLREHVDRSFLARILSDRWPPFGSNRPCIVSVLRVFIMFFTRCVFASATFSLSPRFPIDLTTRSVKIGHPRG